MSNGDGRTDPILRRWVEEANAGGATRAVTLWMGGSITSGTLISTQEYLRGLAKSWSAAPGGETLAAHYSELAETEKERVDLLPFGNDKSPPSYIHLRDVHTFAAGAGPLPSEEGMLWRGRLDRVDAFSFGRLASALP